MFCRDDPEGEFVCYKSCCSLGMIQSGSFLPQELFMFCRDLLEGGVVCYNSCLCSVWMIQRGSLSATRVVYVLQG